MDSMSTLRTPRAWLLLVAAAWLAACGDAAGGNGIDDTGADASFDTFADAGQDPSTDAGADAADGGGDDGGGEPDLGGPDASDEPDLADASNDPDAADEPDAPVNNPPAPTAAPIITLIGETGTSQIAVNDPDPADTATFEVTVAPLLGEATVSESGLVTYTSSGDAYGPDALAVTVTDGSGATAEVAIDVEVTLYEYDGLGVAFPEEQCEEVLGHIALIDIDPPLGTVLPPDTNVDVTATLFYSIGPDDELSLAVTGAGGASTLQPPINPEDDCGTIELTASFPSPPGGESVFVHFPGSRYEAYYHVSLEDEDTNVFGSFDAVSVPPGSVLREPFYEVLAEVSFDLVDYGIEVYDAQLDLADLETGGNKHYDYFYPISLRERLPVRLVGRLSCEERDTGFEIFADPDEFDDMQSQLVYPAVAPAIEVFHPFESYAVIEADSTFETGATSCGEARDVVLTASDDWFEPTVSELTIDQDTTLGIVVHGALLTEGEVNVGTLTIAPQVEGDFAPVEVPVRVTRLSLSATGEAVTQIAFPDGDRPDDDVDVIDLDFTFPAEGGEFDQIVVSTNGMIGLQRTGEEPVTCADPDAYEQPAEPWDGFQPDFQGCPVIAPGWADHGFFMQRGDLENPAPGAYLGMGTTDGVAWVEVVFWNLHQYVSTDDGYRLSSTRVVRLREDGTFSMSFPIANLTGLEMVGWAHSDGSMEDPLVPPLSIADGDVFEFAPIPALIAE